MPRVRTADIIDVNMPEVRNSRVTVAGLGRFGGGIGVARWLVAQGAKVLVTDREPAEKLSESVRQLNGLPIEFHLGGHVAEHFTQADLVVRSPAIPPHSEFIQAARRAGVPVTTEIQLFIERCPAPIVGVTGTKGKSTTSRLLSLILEARYKVWTGGNIGGSLLLSLPQIHPDHVVVLELSSYMLEYLGPMRWSPHVAVVTMIAVDHVEWHGSPQAYQDAKRNIVRFQSPDDVAVLGPDSDASSEFAHHTRARVVRYGLPDARPFALEIPGKHNQLNAQAAFVAANALGVSWDDAQNAVRDFAGLPHRLQLVHESNGVRWFNDSIATIPEAAIAALESFPPQRVIQIVGGYDKHLDMGAMCQSLADRASAVLTIGATGPVIAAAIRAKARGNTAVVRECVNVETAITVAREIARDGDVVLLSTGCASYDQFVNFEERGDVFTRLVKDSR
jgi:UDP-N-acetylmuramoylalanine--D-glutamate ligase